MCVLLVLCAKVRRGYLLALTTKVTLPLPYPPYTSRAAQAGPSSRRRSARPSPPGRVGPDAVSKNGRGYVASTIFKMSLLNAGCADHILTVVER
jgi:hypothetical protein